MDAMCANIDRHINEGKPFDLLFASRSCAADVIFDICFGHHLDSSSLPGFSSPILHAIHTSLPMIMVFKHFPIVQKMIQFIPPSVMGALQPELKGFVQMREVSLTLRTRRVCC